MIILGLNTWFHDTSACIVRDGKLVVALEEERFTRHKHTREFPLEAIRHCLAFADITPEEIDHVAVSIRPWQSWHRKAVHLAKAPHRAAPFLRHELVAAFFKQRRLRRWFADTFPGKRQPKLHFIEHHASHATGSYFVSPYEHAAIITLDGSGEWASGWLGAGRGNTVTRYTESLFPHSLGAVYEAVTEFCGFRPNYDEGKTMGLAPLGDPARFIDAARECVHVDEEGRIRVDPSWFSYQYWGYQRCSTKFHATFGKPRASDGEFASHHRDVAAAFQQVLEECALKMARQLREKTRANHLVIAGGVALNSVMNGRLLRETEFDDVYIMPAAGDGGTAIGAAFTLLHQTLGAERCYVHDDPYLGNVYSDDEIERFLKACKLPYRKVDNPATAAADLLEAGRIIGWFQGRMEIGPRALGGRSILANPAIPDMKAKINSEVKFREAYRPFAPSATVEAAADFFDIDVEAPFMLKVCQVREDKQSVIPAVTHVDGSARLQTVRRDRHPLYHELIDTLGSRTGVPVVLNTSFNIQGEPVVESPRDAVRCFYSTGLDNLVIGACVLGKQEGHPENRPVAAGPRHSSD